MSVVLRPPGYLESPHPQLWTYVDDGDAAVWCDTDETAWMSGHAAVLCERLMRELGGLPSLTAVLFLADAISKGWSKEAAERRIAKLVEPMLRNRPKRMTSSYSYLADWLVSIGRVSPDLRRGAAAQAAWMCELWEDLPQKWLEADGLIAVEAVHWLRVASAERRVGLFQSSTVSDVRCGSALQALEFASMHAVDEESLRIRMRTGLDQVPPPPKQEIELPPPDAYRRLISALQSDADADMRWVGGSAGAAASTLTLPRKLSEPDELQLAGISDITNRGRPDRLLMTELASDPDLLIARIANGQALYVRRESPPRKRPQKRRVVLESNIRCWGEPRLSMLAVALAAAASEERRGGSELHFMTVDGDQILPEVLTDISGFMNCAERLSAQHHSIQGMNRLVKQWKESSEDFAEPLFIVTSATAQDKAFKSVLSDIVGTAIVATVEPDRWVDLSEHSAAGVRHLQRFRLTPLSRSQSSNVAKQDDLPLFVQQATPPLRFALDSNAEVVATYHGRHGQVVWSLASDHRLLMQDHAALGAVEVGSLFNESVLASDCPDSRTMVAVMDAPARGEGQVLVRAEVGVGITVSPIPRGGEGAGLVDFAFDRNRLLRIGRSTAFINTTTGDIECEEPIRGRYISGHFFQDQGELLVAKRARSRVEWQSLGACPGEVGLVVRRDNMIPIAYAFDLTWTKRFDATEDCEEQTQIRIHAGYWRLIWSDPKSQEFIVRIDNLQSEAGLNVPAPYAYITWLSLKPNTRSIQYIRERGERELNKARMLFDFHPLGNSLVKRFQRIGVHNGYLVLAYDQEKFYRLDSDDDQQELRMGHTFDAVSFDDLVPFGDSFSVPASGIARRWMLRRADLEGGTAWLDSRGLLHLRDKQGSELTLVLSAPHVSGWFNGESFGRRYFTGESKDSKLPIEVLLWLRRWVEQCSP